MTYLKAIVFLLLVSLSNNLYSQSINLSGRKPYRGLHIFLLPMKSDKGEKQFQFSFTKFTDVNDKIRFDSLVLSTSSGKKLILSNPKIPVTEKDLDGGKKWYSTFSLNKEEIEFVKKEVISEMYILINGTEEKVIFPNESRIELHELLTEDF